MASLDSEIAKTQEEKKALEQQLAKLTSVAYDKDLYGGGNRFEDYKQSIPVNDEEENLDAMDSEVARKLVSYTALKSIPKDMPRGTGEDLDEAGFKRPQSPDVYKRTRSNGVISPERHDAFAAGDKTPDVSARIYRVVMQERLLEREKDETLKAIAKKKEEEKERKAAGGEKESSAAAGQPSQKRRNRWYQSQEDNTAVKKTKSDWDLPDSTPGIGRWDVTPTSGRVIGDATPSLSRRNKWILKDMPRGAGEDLDKAELKRLVRIFRREEEYSLNILNRGTSPDRHHAFAAGDKTPDVSVRTYQDVVQEELLKKKKEEEERKVARGEKESSAAAAQPILKRRYRWNQSQEDNAVKKAKSDWDILELAG